MPISAVRDVPGLDPALLLPYGSTQLESKGLAQINSGVELPIARSPGLSLVRVILLISGIG
jgi:hypothetical protein